MTPEYVTIQLDGIIKDLTTLRQQMSDNYVRTATVTNIPLCLTAAHNQLVYLAVLWDRSVQNSRRGQ